MRNNLILIGEDDPDDEEFLTEIFRSLDGSLLLLFKQNGDAVLNYLSNAAESDLPSLILLDYNMPGLNGQEILKELKKDPRFDAIPRLIWSTSRSAAHREMCITSGASDYLVKPSNVNDLEEMCRYMLSTFHR